MTRSPLARAALAGVAIVGLLAMAGCSAVSGGTASTDSPSGAARTVSKITYVNPLPSYPAFNVAGECFKKEAKKFGWSPTEVGITGTGVDNQGSINQISQATASGADALVVFPTVTSLFTPVIQAARQKGLYVVALNAGAPSTGQQTQVGTDQAQMGATMADGLGKVAPNAHVGFISLSASTAPHAQAIKGFQDEAAAKFPNMKTVASEYDGGDATKDVDIFRNMIAAHPDMDAIFPIEGAAISAAVTAVQEAGKTDSIKVLGLDLTDQTRELLTQGKLYGVGDQGWCEMGTKAVDAVKSLQDGKKLPALIPTKVTFYTVDNLPAQ
ncbi:MAG: ABC-type sugar transport system, periplasmic component [Microbacteriaceae bacterium]|jgi:ribose transport system substrate-binding protein|nr:ABC-type sugar transport system, periplasmic component [Microbacteriaceae bacterium]